MRRHLKIPLPDFRRRFPELFREIGEMLLVILGNFAGPVEPVLPLLANRVL